MRVDNSADRQRLQVIAEAIVNRARDQFSSDICSLVLHAADDSVDWQASWTLIHAKLVSLMPIILPADTHMKDLARHPVMDLLGLSYCVRNVIDNPTLGLAPHVTFLNLLAEHYAAGTR